MKMELAEAVDTTKSEDCCETTVINVDTRNSRRQAL